MSQFSNYFINDNVALMTLMGTLYSYNVSKLKTTLESSAITFRSSRPMQNWCPTVLTFMISYAII